jgi:UPF0042 nucleotide-binding protein
MNQNEKKTKKVTGIPLLIITGLSGAGKSTAMRFLEDLGCYCVDNLPPALVTDFFNLHENSTSAGQEVVIASDVRSGTLFDDFSDMVESLNDLNVKSDILYLDCSTDTLIKRFGEVRRNHPLQGERSMIEAIEEERRLLEPIRVLSTKTIDTSDLEASHLRETIIRKLIGKKKSHMVTLEFISFGFKYGIPRNVDFVFDARFLPNPFYIPELRAKTGLSDEVYQYVMSNKLADAYFKKIVSLIELTLEAFVGVGKTDLTIGIGCTGGRHRSVAFAKRMVDHFVGEGKQSRSAHRDISKSKG